VTPKEADLLRRRAEISRAALRRARTRADDATVQHAKRAISESNDLLKRPIYPFDTDQDPDTGQDP
jgi:hypothetical protein